MSLGSLFSGMALANARLGAVHGFAGPIGGMYPAAHGAICARLLPVTMEVNVKALRSRASQSPALQRLDEVGQLLTGDEKADADEGVRWLRELCAALKIPALVSYGIEHNDIPEIVAQAKKARSMQGNPIELTDSELTQIMELAL
jgi:alcohol dehydrogenase class IV